MLIPIIKDFNNAFSYLVSNSVEKTKEVFDPVSKSVLHLSQGQSDQSGAFNDLFKIGWTTIQICFSFLVQTIQYIISFQWLRDFAYLPVSIPNSMLHSNENRSFIQTINDRTVALVEDRQNVLQRFLFSNQTMVKPESGLAISSDHSLPYNNFILGLPNVTHIGAPLNSWSLSFLSNKWFDPLTVPVNFLSTGLESGGKTTTHLSSLPEQITGDLRISNIILMSILICIATGFSSFLNGFFVFFPLSLSNLLSLRYLTIQKFWAGCVSVLGIVFGEVVFSAFLILPPPFIQITLVYLESVWPYIIGLSLTVFIIFDLVSNPYTNTMSLSQSNNQMSSATNMSPLTKQRSISGSTNLGPTPSLRLEWNVYSLTRFLTSILKSNTTKIFGFSFLLALTEQSCYFSFFGSLNLSSTGNFLDTYLFAASRSPIILLFSCVGFFIGSFLATITYNLVIAKTIFLTASLGIKIKSYNPDFVRRLAFNRQTMVGASIDSSKDSKYNWVFILRVYTNIKRSIMSRLRSIDFQATSKDRFKSLLLGGKNVIQFFIRLLPGGRQLILFLLPRQAHSYKSDFQATSLRQNLNNKEEEQLSGTNQSFPVAFSSEPKSAFLSIETRIESMLRSDSLNMSSSTSASIPSQSPRDSLPRNNQPSGNASQLGGSAFYNKIDKVLLTCLVTLSFTTIPYYSFDYLINSFFGFQPQEQILNAHSLRVNFPDYTNLLGITLSDNNSVINTDVSLYDRAHFMYGEWPNSFESLNYQGELMWTNLRDHRRQKRTRRSTRLKFKTLKTKISTSWKEFKRNSGFSGSTRSSSFDDSPITSAEENRQAKLDPATTYDSNVSNKEGYEGSKAKMPSEAHISSSSQKTDFPTPLSYSQIDNGVHTIKDRDRSNNQGFDGQNNVYQDNHSKAQKSMRSYENLSNLFYKIVLPSRFQGMSLNQDASVFSNRFKNTEAVDRPFLTERKNDRNPIKGGKVDGFQPFEPISQTRGIPKDESMPKIPEVVRRSTSLSETIKPLSTSTFTDLSGGEKYIKTYPKNWKRVITEKYYQNPIYQTVLSNDLRGFLKREPLTQQLTKNQENELYLLRVKMAHYYDSLRFYFTLKESINSTRSKADGTFKSGSERNQNQSKTFDDSFSRILGLKNQTKDTSIFRDSKDRGFNQKPKQSSITKIKSEPIITGVEESLKGPPFQFKSMTSMNYRQQFKGTLKTVKQLFAISLPQSISGFSNAQDEQNPFKYSARNYEITSKETNQPTNAFLEPTGRTEPVEKSYKYDKYLFNEYAYPKNEFLHEEGRGFTNRKSNTTHLRESHVQNSTLAPTGTNERMSSNESTGSRGYRGIGLATKNIYSMFGSNDPFYVGWDQNLRKFVLTSRILSRSSALNYNATNSKLDVGQNKKQKRSDFSNNNPIRDSSVSDLGLASSPRIESKDRRGLTNQIKKKIDKEELDGSSIDPIYSTKDVKRLAEKKPDLNQQSVHIYRPYTSWPFFKHQLKNLPNRPYFVLYENYLNILNKRIHLFRNININDIDTKSLTFLYSYSFNNNVKKYVSQLPINIYKQSMRPSSLENLFTPTSNSRSSFLWPGSTMPAWEYYFW